MSHPTHKLRALFLCHLLFLSTIAGAPLFVGTASAANQALITTVAPSDVDENQSVTHTVDFTVTGLSPAAGSGSNDSISIVFPDTVDNVSSYSITATDGNGTDVTPANLASNDTAVSFEINDTSGPDELRVNASVTVDWGSIDKTTEDNVSVVVTDSDGSVVRDQAGVTIRNVESSDTKSQQKANDILESRGTFWLGHTLFFDGSNVVAGSSKSDRTFHVKNVTRSGDAWSIGDTVTEFRVDSTHHTALIDTGGIDDEGYYAVVYQSDVVVINDNGVATNTERPGDDELKQAAWWAVHQYVDATTDDPVVSGVRPDPTTINIVSNRGQYRLRITADDLSADDLEQIFNHSSNDVVNVNHNKNRVTVRVTDRDELVANFTGIDPGNYKLKFNVVDTDASSSVAIEVLGRDADISFTHDTYTDHVGDPVNITMDLGSTHEAFLFVGGGTTNYLESVHVVDDNDDGQVVVQINTWAVGQAAKNGNRPGFRSTEGVGYRILGDDEFGAAGITRYNRSFFDGHLDIAPDLSAPLDPAPYDLRLATTDRINTETGELRDQQDNAVLALNSRHTTSITTLIAPADSARVRHPVNLVNRATATDVVPINPGARLIVAVDASGLYGYVEDGDLTTLQQNGVNLTIEERTRPTNRDPIRFDLASLADSPGVSSLYTDPRNDTFYVVIDLTATEVPPDGAFEPGQEYTATFTVGDADASSSPNPYVEPGTEESVNTTFTIQDAAVDVDQGPNFTIASGNPVTVSGTTNLPPGAELTVTLEPRDRNGTQMKLREVVTVTHNQTWTATFSRVENTDRSGFTVSFASDGQTLATAAIGRPIPDSTAALTVTDQAGEGGILVVRTAMLSHGGFVVVHNTSHRGPVLASSTYLPAGEHTDIQIPFDGIPRSLVESNANTTLDIVVRAYHDTNDNGVFDGPSIDTAYSVSGQPVANSIEYTVLGQPPAPTPEELTKIQVQTVVKTELTPIPTPAVKTKTVVKIVPGNPGGPSELVALSAVVLYALIGAVILLVSRKRLL